MKRLSDLNVSFDPARPKADISNAPHLMGDVDLLSEYAVISGDPDLYGAPNEGPSWAARNKTAIAAAGGATAGAATMAIINKIRDNQKAADYQKKLSAARAKQTLNANAIAKRQQGSIALHEPVKFFHVSGAQLNQAPLATNMSFAADTLKNMMDRQSLDTPFYQETAIGTYSAGTWTAEAVGDTNTRYFHALILQIGTNPLNAAPGTVFNITATIPTIMGNLTISSVPFTFTYNSGFDVRFMFFPWALVSNVPIAVLGAYKNSVGYKISVSVTGLPSASAVSLIVPGSLHPWTVAQRNRLVR